MATALKLHIPTVRMVRALCRVYRVRTCREAFRKAYEGVIGGSGAIADTDFRLFCEGDRNPPAYLQRACIEAGITLRR